MILADIQTTIGVAVMVFGLFVGLVMTGIVLLVRALGRSVRDGYHKEGGAAGMARKVAARGAGELFKRVILKR